VAQCMALHVGQLIEGQAWILHVFATQGARA
jgi:hypothetical protein